MALNIPLAQQVLAQIEEHPEQHNQAWFAIHHPECGTQYCIAGWALHLAGYQITLNGDGFNSGLFSPEGKAMMFWREDDDRSYAAGGPGTIPETAAEVLGLSIEVADQLFYKMNNEGAKEMLSRLIDEAVAKQAAREIQQYVELHR